MSGIALGRVLVFIGAFIVLIGILIMMGGRIPFLGKLPGDIHIEKENFSFYFPVTTCIIVSIILSLLFLFFSRK